MFQKNKMFKLIGTYLLLFVAAFSVQAQDEPLMPEVAFKFNARVLDANTIRAEWNIADKYYLYRDKIRFSTDTPEISIGQLSLPKGKLKHGILPDGTEGEVETFMHTLSLDIPLQRNNPALKQFTLIAHSQGCAEIGICYPPQKQKVALQLPAAPAGQNAVKKLSALSNSLGLSGSDDDILPAEQAFQLELSVADANTILARWFIADKHYMYRDKINVKLKNVGDVRLMEVILPEGEMKNDIALGKTLQVFHNQLEVPIKLARGKQGPTDVTIELSYQGCAEERGICYPPIKRSETLTLPAASTVSGLSSIATTEQPALSEQDSIAAALKAGGLLVILTFYGFGLLLAFTPCVFPMIPILSSIIVGQGDKLTTRRAFIMSLTYVLAMAVTYTAAGVFAGIAGENLQAAFQNPWVLSTFAGVFVLLAFSMFGFYELQLPSSWQSKLTEVSNKQEGGTLTGVAIMGFLSALIVGPCVAAPLAGALIYIGQTGDAVLGGLALFALSLGMGTPLVAIGTSAGKLLPRAGGWMDAVKGVFGVMLLAVAIWMLERILPASITMLLWAILLIVSAVYLKALEPLNIESTGWAKLWKGIGLLLFVYGILLMIGVASGGKDIIQPLKGIGFGSSQEQHLAFKRIKSVDDLNRELQSAGSQNKFVMLDFYADWCTYCKDYEKNVFPDPSVQQALSNVVLLQADVTANDEQDKTLLKHLQIPAPPAILFFAPGGQERRASRLVGLKTRDEFVAHVENALR